MGALKISVVIATLNRRDDLGRTLEAYRRQSHTPVEIVVVDNGSDDGTREMIESTYPDVVYEWFPVNRGTFAINRGMEKATGDVIWLSNNDSHPESDRAFEEIAGILERCPDVHVIGTEDVEMADGGRVFNWHPLPVDKAHPPACGYPTNLFHGTGAAVRANVVRAIGGFWEVFGFEEMDFCARAIGNGFNVRYFPKIRTLHFASPRERPVIGRWVAATGNMMRYIWRHLPTGEAIHRSLVYYPYFILQGLAIGAGPRQLWTVITGMPAAALRTIRTERRVVPEERVAAVTLGVGPERLIWNYVRPAAARRWRRWRRTT